MYCIYLRKRKNKPFCKLLNKEIPFFQCQECGNKEYKTKNINNSFYKNILSNNHQMEKCPKSNKKSAFQEKKTPKTSNKVQKLKKQSYKHQKADRNRFSIITNDLEHCIICGAKKDNLHEVFYGSYRHTSIKYGLVIPLCEKHHTKGDSSIHHDREFDLKMKFLAQDIFVKKYSLELFTKEFGMDYIEKYK